MASQLIVMSAASMEAPTMELLGLLAASIAVDFDDARFWLLMVAVGGAMPTRDEYVRGRRLFQLAARGEEEYALLSACSGIAHDNDNFGRFVRLSRAPVVVDVDFTARHGYNTGVQRVVRETLARWDAIHEIELVAWTEEAMTMRALVPEERKRVVNWDSSMAADLSPRGTGEDGELVIPWKATLVMPEVAQARFWQRLACLAEFSGNRVVLVGYDMIPASSAEYVVPTESDRFVRYLSVVKYAAAVAAISESSAQEFRGYTEALAAQDLTGPLVASIPLPVDLPNAPPARLNVSRSPLVLAVGTQEPRKNHLAVLAAAEMLWREGLDFQLMFVGSGAHVLAEPFDVEIARLQQAGRNVVVERAASDEVLTEAYHRARFSVFVSMHEGYGLPMGESLAAGTPVLATSFGSMGEIGAGGGCVLVDPRNDSAIADEMRRMLTNDQLISRLSTESRLRPKKTWDDYAAEVWHLLIESANPVL